MVDYCCTNCFNDQVIKEHIYTTGAIGRCSFCKSTQVKTVNPHLLFMFIERFLEILNESGDGDGDGDGDTLFQILTKEFCFFNLEEHLASDLFRIIMAQAPEIIKKTYNRFDPQLSINAWLAFKNELKAVNRFFPQTPIYKELFSKGVGSEVFFTMIESLSVNYGTQDLLYRARSSEQPLNIENMWKPPSDKASAGRANPVGISYLYLAENTETCIAEIRPSNGSKACIAVFHPKTEIRLLDLTAPRKNVPYLLLEGDALKRSLDYIALLEVFSRELSLPVLPERSHLDYIPTQFICEFFKTVCKYDGIIFLSSFQSGKNIVLFDEKQLKSNKPVDHVIISSINHSYSPVTPD